MVNQSDVDAIFSSVASKYDIMNDVMSLGLHRLWKKQLCSRIVKDRAGCRLLDVAGGTGDIALAALKRNRNLDIVVCDINPDVLKIGRKKAVNSGNIIDWVCASAEQLPFPSNYFDYYTIAFGIRNVPNRRAALSEAYRVLKPHGNLLCLEFSPLPHKNTFSNLYDLYSFFVIPKIGDLITKNKHAYFYLVNSIRAFPSPEKFAEELSEAGFWGVTHTSMCNGIVSLHSGWKCDIL